MFVNEITAATLQPNGKEYTFRTSNNLGAFSTAGIKFTSNYLSTMAWGYYFDEITGKQSTDVVALAGLSDITAGADTSINVNALSSMAVNRITKLATQTSPLTFTAARAQAQKDVLGAFYIYNGSAILTGTTVNNVAQPANLTALDLSKNRAGDQMLAALSGVLMKAGANGNGVNTLLSQIAVDLGDDGLLNNSPNYTPSVSTQLCAAADVTDFAAIATNLNKLYGTKYTATDLSQWVDSSGCVDQVIDKFKFSASDVKTSTVSKSPAYVAGHDDVGQCFSVGNATTGAIAKLYYKGSTTAVVGTQKVVLGDSMTVGISAANGGTFSAFIRRSAPDSTGACPSTAPTNGLARVQKYSIATVQTYTVGGTVTGLAAGQSVTLLNNGGNARTVSANGTFTFTTAIASGAPYAVTVGTQLAGKGCTVANGTGEASANVINIGIVCGEPIYAVSTLAGNGAAGSTDGNGASAKVYFPEGVAVDAAGNVYFTESITKKVRKITAAGLVSTLAGSGSSGREDGAGARATFKGPRGLAVDSAGDLYVADAGNNNVRKITAAGAVSTLTGYWGSGSLDGNVADATFSSPYGVSTDAMGNVYVADKYNNKIRKITKAGMVSTLAGRTYNGSTDGTGASAMFFNPTGVAVDTAGSVYVADFGNHKIRKITAAGMVSTIAGSGAAGSTDGAAATATFNYPQGIAVDTAGNVYVADTNNHRIRKITAAGVVSTVAGSGIAGDTDGAGSSASFNYPLGVTVDTNGVICVADTYNHKIRKITPQ